MPGVDVSDVGTGISFSPATRFAHVSGDAVQALGSGIALDRPLAKGHAYGAALGNPLPMAGYQGSPAPNQWFGSVLLRQSRLDRVDGRKRRGGGRRHGLRIPAK